MSDSEPPPRRLKILVTTLDWGLGHSSRMIPVIQTLLGHGEEVVLASSGSALELLRIEFPQLECVEMPAYGIRYAATAHGFRMAMLVQAPSVLRAIRRERKFLARLQEQYRFDGVISDNRFGARIDDAYNVFVTHQLSIRFPVWLSMAGILVNIVNRHYISRFQQCWVPDFKGRFNLSGRLSHHLSKPSNVIYVGPLSRFMMMDELSKEEEFDLDLLIILSGPEPQRSLLENILHDQILDCDIAVKLVRGIPGPPTPQVLRPGYAWVRFEDAAGLYQSMQRSPIVLCRAGYSSIMDLALTGKDAILIPTPGQTEQEYLAARLKRHKVFYSESQEGFSIWRALDEARAYSVGNIKHSETQLPRAVEDFIQKCRNKRDMGDISKEKN